VLQRCGYIVYFWSLTGQTILQRKGGIYMVPDVTCPTFALKKPPPQTAKPARRKSFGRATGGALRIPKTVCLRRGCG